MVKPAKGAHDKPAGAVRCHYVSKSNSERGAHKILEVLMCDVTEHSTHVYVHCRPHHASTVQLCIWPNKSTCSAPFSTQ
jgi:hypothetical protein